MNFEDIQNNNPFEDDVEYAKCQAILNRGQQIVTERPQEAEAFLDLPFSMALAKLMSSGMMVPRGGDLLAFIALVMGVIEIRKEDTTVDDTARNLLNYEGGEIDLE